MSWLFNYMYVREEMIMKQNAVVLLGVRNKDTKDELS